MFLFSDPSPRWSALRGSAELRAYSSLPRHQDCSFPILNHPSYSSSTPPDPETNENLSPLTNSLISPPLPSQQQSLQSQNSVNEKGDTPGTPTFQAHVQEAQPPLSFQDHVHTSPLTVMARQRRYSPNRDCIDRGICKQEQYIIDGHFCPGERDRGRGFLNRNAKSESDNDYRVPVTSTPLMDHSIHDGYSSSPTSRRRELLKQPKFGDTGSQHPSEVVACSRHYSDIRQSFSDDSSPTPVRNNMCDQRDEKRKSMIEQVTAKTSMIDEEQKIQSLVGHDDRRSSAIDEEPKQEHRGNSVTALESVKLISNNQSSVTDSTSVVSQEDLAPVKPQRRHPLIRSSERAPLLSHNSHSISSIGHTDIYHGGSIALEYSGNSDSGGEIMATPPMPSRRFGGMSSAGKRSDDGPLEESPGPGGSSPASIRASSGDDIMDAEPLFRKVTIKKRRQETRRLVDGSGKLKTYSCLFTLHMPSLLLQSFIRKEMKVVGSNKIKRDAKKMSHFCCKNLVRKSVKEFYLAVIINRILDKKYVHYCACYQNTFSDVFSFCILPFLASANLPGWNSVCSCSQS